MKVNYTRGTILSVSFCGVLLSGCGVMKTDDQVAKVTTCQIVQKVDADGKLARKVECSEETASKSVVDKGAETLLTAQKMVAVDAPFTSYNIGPKGEVVASVFEKEGGGSSDVWVFGAGKVRLTKTAHLNNSPNFSRDGSKIYFASNRGQAQQQSSYIWRMTTTGGGGLTRIGTPVYSYSNPVESPDGSKLLYSVEEFYGAHAFIWYSGVTGNLPTQLTEGEDAVWLSNEKILFSAADESTGVKAIWTVNTDGSQLTQLVSDKDYDCIQPAPSSDGKYIAYVKQKKGEPHSRDIYVFTSENGLSQQLTTNISRDDMPKWSKDDKDLYFRSTRGLSWNIWRVSATNF